MNSRRGLAKATIKGMPGAVKTIGRKLKRFAAGGSYGEMMNERYARMLERAAARKARRKK
jgi:hypothetical protein